LIFVYDCSTLKSLSLGAWKWSDDLSSIVEDIIKQNTSLTSINNVATGMPSNVKLKKRLRTNKALLKVEYWPKSFPCLQKYEVALLLIELFCCMTLQPLKISSEPHTDLDMVWIPSDIQFELTKAFLFDFLLQRIDTKPKKQRSTHGFNDPQAIQNRDLNNNMNFLMNTINTNNNN